jgi:D-sedoheptulose 7-phosphate isomerase
MEMMDWTKRLIDVYPELVICEEDIQKAIQILSGCFKAGGKLLVCGNGGSAADSEHIVGELMKGYMSRRPLSETIRQKFLTANNLDGLFLADHLQGALPAISLVSQSSLISAFSNDVNADLVYAQQVYGYGRTSDVLWGISTSGNAKNVNFALQTAQTLGMKTIGLSGPSGGKMKDYCDVIIRVPGDSTPAIQERHLPVYHTICAMLEQELFHS